MNKENLFHLTTNVNFELHQNYEKRRDRPHHTKNRRFVDIEKPSSTKIWSQFHQKLANAFDLFLIFRFPKFPSQLSRHPDALFRSAQD
jgi:hypothetical protein